MISAARGVSARVDTEVAMALAESWKPLVYSKHSATTTTSSRTAVSEPVLRPTSVTKVTASSAAARASASLGPGPRSLDDGGPAAGRAGGLAVVAVFTIP